MKFTKYLKISGLACLVCVIGCTEDSDQKNQRVSFEVTNDLDFKRGEVVSVAKTELKELLKNHQETSIRVQRKGDSVYQQLQWFDANGDGVNDELLFFAEVAPKSAAVYEVVIDSLKSIPETDVKAYSRFVPERTDDYTWENDKVAFRTYGPDAQLRAEEHRENGTLSSGIDLWLKRTDKSIINKWYKGYLTDPMFYHRDKGEGYDPYHVGGSRGTGGIGVYENDSLYVSKNFVSYKTISDGPLRTVFELSYAPWSPYKVEETKKITLDMGSNFSKFEVALKSAEAVPNYAVGITLHEKKGVYRIETDKGLYSHWEQIDDAYVGEGIVINTKVVDTAFAKITEVKDQSNLLIVTKPQDVLTYYAGFVWTKSGQAATEKEWEVMLSQKVAMIENPLKVKIID